MNDYMNLSREEVHAFLEQSLADLEELRREKARGAVTVGPINRSIACLRYLQEVMGMLDIFMDQSEPRVSLCSADQITMGGLRKLNQLIAKYDSRAQEVKDGR